MKITDDLKEKFMNMLKSSNGAKTNNDEVIQTGNKVHYISLYDLS